MMNSYVNQRLSVVKGAASNLRNCVDVIRVELNKFVAARDALVNAIDQLEQEIERAEEYKTSVYIPEDLRELLYRYMEKHTPKEEWEEL